MDALYDQWSGDIENARRELLFPLYPNWVMVEAKIAIGIMSLSLILIVAQFVIRWKKRALWAYRLEGDGYYRPNILFFVPIFMFIFLPMYIIILVGRIKRNIPEADHDWFPYYTVFQLAFYIPLYLIAATWTWNTILSATHAETTAFKIPPHASNTRRYSVRSLKINPAIAQLTLFFALFISLCTLFVLGCIAAVYRERIMDALQILGNYLGQARTGHDLSLDSIGIIIRDFYKNRDSAKKSAIIVAIFNTVILLLLTVPYACTFIYLVFILRLQRNHFKRAITRLKNLDEIDQAFSAPQSPRTPQDNQLTKQKREESVDGFSEFSLDFSTDMKRQQYLSIPSKDGKVDHPQFTATSNTSVQQQEAETLKRMTEWNRNFKRIVIMNCTTLLIYAGYNASNILNMIVVCKGYKEGDFYEKATTFVSIHVPIYCFCGPGLCGNIFMLIDAIRLDKQPPDESDLELQDQKDDF